MVGFYFFMKDLMLPIRSSGLLGSVLYFFRSILPAQAVKLIFSASFFRLKNPHFGKEMAHRFGFQGEPKNKFSLYERKAISKSWNPKVFEHDFTHSKCSYSMGNCLFLPPLLLLAVRGFYFLSSGCTGSREFCHLWGSDALLNTTTAGKYMCRLN